MSSFGLIEKNMVMSHIYLSVWKVIQPIVFPFIQIYLNSICTKCYFYRIGWSRISSTLEFAKMKEKTLCSFCKKSFVNLLIHQRKQHPNELKRSLCPCCPESNSVYNTTEIEVHNLQEHTNQGSENEFDAMIECMQCSDKFFSQDLLKKHFESKHQIIYPKKCNCKKITNWIFKRSWFCWKIIRSYK